MESFGLQSVKLIRAVIAHMSRIAYLIAPPVLRMALAVPFFKSGLTKWDGFLSLAPTAQFLFESEFQLHLFGHAYAMPFPDIMAYADGVAEIVLPILLAIGLATRFSALGLLVMTGVIELVVPEGWANFHLPWASMAIAIMALGPGKFSLDYVIARWFGKSTGVKPT